MRLNEFTANDIPQIGDILEIEIANEIVETVIVGINRGNYIVESTSTDLLESKLNEVDPRNYDSDWDYYDAVKRSGRRPSDDDFDMAKDVGPSDEDIYYAKQKASMASAPQQRQVDGDGQAPNGERYNTVVTFTSADNNRNKIAADSYKDYHWGAKKVVDSKQANGVYTLYVVDNHKHGMWKPWKDQPAEGVAEEFNGEYDDEAGMAQSNLRTMARAVDGLIDTIKDNDNLPEWAQEKIAKAEMMTTSVWDYLLSQKEQGMDPKVTEASQRVDSLVTDALKIMRGSTMNDAIQALKTVLGDREFSGRRGHYNFYVRQLMDMYGQQGNLKEFAPGPGGGESGRWYTDDQMTDIVGDGWWQDLDVGGDIPKQQMIQEAQAWLNDQGYSVQVLNCKVNDDDMEWFIEGSFQNSRFAKKGMAEAHGNSKIYDKCWDGHKKVPGKKRGEPGSCVKESLNERAEKKEKVKVYVKNPKTGRVVKVDFGEPGQLIKKSKKHRKHGKKRWNLKK